MSTPVYRSALEPEAIEPAATEASVLARVRAVTPRIAAAAERIEADREIPEPVLEAMHEAEMFRLSLPDSVSGAELPVPALACVAETVATADASVAWCLGQGLGCAMSAAFLDEGPARAVFGPRDAVLAWGAGAQGKAVAVEGGYRVTGRWRFASGGKHATWLGGHCMVFEGDGTPRLGPDGVHANRTALFPRDRASIADDWHVMGLRGTRSEGYAVEDLFVEEAYTLDRDTPAECRVQTTLYRFPTTIVFAAMFSGVALGIARAMLDDLVTLTGTKTARGARSSMRESPVIHTRLAELEGQLGAARAYQQQAIRTVWAEVEASPAITLAQRVRIRLATTYAINAATAVSEQVYRLAGSTAIFEGEPFERRFRDAHAVSQQVQARHTNFETVGRFMLGLDVDTMFL